MAAARSAATSPKISALLAGYSLVTTLMMLQQRIKPNCQLVCEPCPALPLFDPSCEEEVDAARQQVLAEAAAPKPNQILLPAVDMLSVLGPERALVGISPSASQPYACALPLKKTLQNSTNEVLQDMQATIKTDLVQLLEGVMSKPVDPARTILQNLRGPATFVNHPVFLVAREAVAEYMARRVLLADGTARCCAAKGKVLTPRELMAAIGEERCGVNCMGYVSGRLMLKSINDLADAAVQRGWCSEPPSYNQGYLNDVVQNRMHSSYKDWFNVRTTAEDTIVFAYQMLAERHMLFKHQRWLGAACLQNPFDAWSIQDIIFTVKPQLIIETGSANGGSALLWASLLQATGVSGKVITIDVEDPALKGHSESGLANPWDNPLWKQFVTFVHGSSTNASVVAKAKQATVNAERVLVLLDSSRAADDVAAEAELYCPLATPGSYCIVQGTKLGRLSSDNPFAGVQHFLLKHPDFSIDRSRELYLLTDHPRGYLKRNG
ncbi:cephalosporin hydroxylase [Micractinium conductrix]|uniref:Cephalosporin hydroxylase n=1 Tax=Micractinium conductrix TaxID=554055 RepID=A0A2P6V5E0_9CHLO|nr:cephalosporin hydroxylase [Micractinium conductrix]|eukprot:PSC69306.1 cephalosporin hydroxylase [Micractinium conductrix]